MLFCYKKVFFVCLFLTFQLALLPECKTHPRTQALKLYIVENDHFTCSPSYDKVFNVFSLLLSSTEYIKKVKLSAQT